MLYALLAVALLAAYFVWWESLYRWGKRPPATLHPPMPYSLKFNAPIAQLAAFLAKSTGNYAVTLPHPWRRKAVVFVRWHYITGPHLAHEVGGHGYQICTMGPADYTATYLWHFVLRKGTWAAHMMEREAEQREADFKREYGPVGTP